MARAIVELSAYLGDTRQGSPSVFPSRQTDLRLPHQPSYTHVLVLAAGGVGAGVAHLFPVPQSVPTPPLLSRAPAKGRRGPGQDFLCRTCACPLLPPHPLP